ncbi:MAG: SNF2-related protein, partial [Planctomycetota bacterium]|nr:SNF2-related protein [Planctomycetota bacterium]
MKNQSLIPAPGQSVYLRSQFFRVNSISALSSIPNKTPQHLISLSQMNENPQSIQIIWELEINPISNHSIQTPLPHNKHSQNYDPYPLLQSILLAHQCSDSIKIHQRCLLSPLKHSLETHPFQFVPAYRTLNNPRINLFLADHVGLGKSIEAGLLISELLAKRRAQRILILCPANLQNQWRKLLSKHFSLNFQIINRQFIQQFHRTHGLTSNPWKNSCFAISSLDFLKQFNQTQLFLQSLKNHNQPIRPWDLLIIDEAHRITPKNHSSLRQSERTKLAKTLIPLFEHRLFISATPHNGSTQNFKALLQLLDPLKFSTNKSID